MRLELRAPDAWFVDEAGQIVEVDAAGDADFVGDVATIRRDFVFTVAPDIAETRATFGKRLAGELDRFVQKEIYLAAIDPIGIRVPLAVLGRDAIAQREVRGLLGRLR